MSDSHDHPVDPVRVATARARLLDDDETGRLVGMLSLPADPTRARILYALEVVDELCVGDIAMALLATEDSVGYGLRVLRTAGTVRPRRQGRVVYYRLAEGFPEPLREHCLRALVELSRRVEVEDPAGPAAGGSASPSPSAAGQGHASDRTSRCTGVRRCSCSRALSANDAGGRRPRRSTAAGPFGFLTHLRPVVPVGQQVQPTSSQRTTCS